MTSLKRLSDWLRLSDWSRLTPHISLLKSRKIRTESWIYYFLRCLSACKVRLERRRIIYCNFYFHHFKLQTEVHSKIFTVDKVQFFKINLKLFVFWTLVRIFFYTRLNLLHFEVKSMMTFWKFRKELVKGGLKFFLF